MRSSIVVAALIIGSVFESGFNLPSDHMGDKVVVFVSLFFCAALIADVIEFIENITD